jgi:hypothetical protein
LAPPPFHLFEDISVGVCMSKYAHTHPQRYLRKHERAVGPKRYGKTHRREEHRQEQTKERTPDDRSEDRYEEIQKCRLHRKDKERDNDTDEHKAGDVTRLQTRKGSIQHKAADKTAQQTRQDMAAFVCVGFYMLPYLSFVCCLVFCRQPSLLSAAVS